MKKLVLLLVISLGLSVANAESVCKEKDSYYIYGFSGLVELIDKDYRSAKNKKTRDKIEAAWSKLLLRPYVGELKRSDKELLCLSMHTTITDYLKTTLTPQEIERFEKYLLKNDKYESYEKNKDNYLNALKFLKHFDKMEYWYSKHNKDNFGMEWQLADSVKRITNYNDDPEVFVERFVYDKSLGNPFEEFQSLNGLKWLVEIFKEHGCENVNVRLKEGCHRTKELKYVIQWAESKQKEAKK